MIRCLVLLCSFVLWPASCGRAQESKGGKGEGSKGELRVEQTDDYLRIMKGDQQVLNYLLSPQLPEGLPEHYTRSGFIHPVWSPSGKIVSDEFPVGYAHQNGFFSAWTNTTHRDSFVDFWNTHKGLGYVRQNISSTMGSPKTFPRVKILKEEGYLGFTASLTHYSRRLGAILSEDLTVRVHDRNDVFIWDVRSEQTNVTEDTLFLNKHLYGGLGVRGSKYWNAKDTANFLAPAQFLTSDGLTRDSANHTHPEWTAIYGDLPGGKAGMAVIPHPENFRWPVAVRVHPDLPYFSVSPVTEAGFFIAPKETYVARYRVVVFDGEVPTDVLDIVKW